jgi:NAD(P) transhydrogenase
MDKMTPYAKVFINDLNYRLNKVLEEQRASLIRRFEKNRIQLVHGIAQFGSPHVPRHILDAQGVVCKKITFDYCLIATGSKPRNPINVPFDTEKVLDSTRLLSIDHVPKTMIVLGGGASSALSAASFFAALGTEVTVIDKREHILPLLDSEIGLHLQKALKRYWT